MSIELAILDVSFGTLISKLVSMKCLDHGVVKLNTTAKDVYKYILWDRNGDILGWAVGRLYGFNIAVFTHCCIEFVVKIKKCVSVFNFLFIFHNFL